jgi:oleate hydratase
MMNAMYYLNDQKKLTELDLPLSQKLLVKEGTQKSQGTYIEELLKEYRLI